MIGQDKYHFYAWNVLCQGLDLLAAGRCMLACLKILEGNKPSSNMFYLYIFIYIYDHIGNEDAMSFWF